jgi:outer membrane protein TolC
MNSRQKLNLVDDVESLQTQAALLARDLELQSTQDQLNATLQTFYTLRGKASNAPVELDPLPEEEWAAQLKDLSNTKRNREDFEALRAFARAEKAQAMATKSSLRPQLDLTASYSSNGRSPTERSSYREVEDIDQAPTWTVGLSFSVPLDFTLTNRLKEASRQKADASQYALEQATFDEARTWEDIIRRRKEAQARYEQALELEKTRTRLVERERSRLRNGRTTTFQQITNEQDLASSQVLRVQTQLNLIQTHNQIKAFVEGL